MTGTEMLADFVINMSDELTDINVLNKAKLHFLDTVGCIFLGCNEKAVKIATEYYKHNCNLTEATVFGKIGEKLSMANAAMINSMAAHVCDFDDISGAFNGHSSAVLVPVVMAVGEKLNSRGIDILKAYIVGSEIDAILGRLLSQTCYNKSWNNTTTIGVLGATAAAGKLMNLSKEQLTYAFGIAVNESGGIKVNYGTMAKDLSVGHCALKGIFSAEMAKRGFTSSFEALEGKLGFFECSDVQDGIGTLSDILKEYTSVFIIPGITIKPYSSCRGNHNGIDCMKKIVEQYDFIAEDIEKIECKVDSAAWDMEKYPIPKNPTQGKFSLPFCIAKVAVNKKISIQDFLGDSIDDTEALKFAKKVVVQADDTIFNKGKFCCEVAVTFKNGKSVVEKSEIAKGDPKNPMTHDEVTEKALGCLETVFNKEKSQEIVSKLLSLDEIPFVKDLISCIYM